MKVFLIGIAIFFTVYLPADAQKADSLNFTESTISISIDDLTLYGTLTIPTTTTKKKIPVVLIIPGSGATDRNGNNMDAGLNCNSYKQLTHRLAENNIASLRYDKRGVGQSKPLYPSSVPKIFETEVNDVKKLVEYLRKQKKFSTIILAGHSQGALVGILASRHAHKFISLCGVALNGAETIKLQLADQPPIVSKKANPIIDSLYQGFIVNDIPQFLEPLFKKNIQPYLITWFRYEPATELSKLKIPVLVIQGDNDIQIRTEDARKFVSLTPKATFTIITGMNHLFKIVPVKKEENLKSYSNPDLPISDIMTKEVIRFILKKDR